MEKGGDGKKEVDPRGFAEMTPLVTTCQLTLCAQTLRFVLFRSRFNI